ncbi:putative inorganic phosphate cotransporter isoform X2 [Aphidius gifuensis]|nr:putative inorganic phosphate cotransporter isoform X2 [Aphidius gifuensis]
MQLPSGYLGRRYSARIVLSLGVMMNGIAGLLCPLAYDLGDWMTLCACRIIMGLSQAALLPCVHTLLSKWVPPNERGKLCSGTYSGAQFGTIIAYLASGYLIDIAGWRFVFYFWGTAAIIWSIIFLIIGSDSPSSSSKKTCCSISKGEKKYIESSLGVYRDLEKPITTPNKKNRKTPWKAIFGSVPFLALIIVHCCQNWGYWMLSTQIPTYLSHVYDKNIKESGLESSYPYIAMMILTIPMTVISDWSRNKNISPGVIRKVSNTIGHWGPGIALFYLTFLTKDNTTLVIYILIVAVGLNAGTLCGFQINHMDLSPNYAGILMAITNCIASIVAIAAPIIVGLVVTNLENIDQWKLIFYASVVIYFVGNLIFIIFGSGDVQWWNNYDNSKNDNDDSNCTSIRPTLSSSINLQNIKTDN